MIWFGAQDAPTDFGVENKEKSKTAIVAKIPANLFGLFIENDSLYDINGWEYKINPIIMGITYPKAII